MKNKIILLAVACLLLAGSTSTEPMSERIIKNSNMETYYNFPSLNLDYRRNIRFILPTNYDSSNISFPTVYVLGSIDNDFPAKENIVFVLIETKLADSTNKESFAKFIEEELVLYTDINYRTKNDTTVRMIMASDTNTSLALDIFNSTNCFLNIALLGASDTTVPPTINSKENVRAYFESNKDKAYLLDLFFSELGLKYGEGMLYKFTNAPAKDILPKETKKRLKEKTFLAFSLTELAETPCKQNQNINYF